MTLHDFWALEQPFITALYFFCLHLSRVYVALACRGLAVSYTIAVQRRWIERERTSGTDTEYMYNMEKVIQLW